MRPTFTSPPRAGTATARTIASAPPLPPSATISCAAPSAGTADPGGEDEIRHILRAAIAAPVGAAQRVPALPECPRSGRARRQARLRLRLGGRAPLPRRIFALAGPRGLPRRGEPAHKADPPRA